MLNLLHSQLENERAIHTKLLRENRKDLIAQMVLQRIEREIKILEDKINGQESRKESVQHKHTRGFVQYVCEALRRFRNHKNGRHYSVFHLPAKAILQASAGVK